MNEHIFLPKWLEQPNKPSNVSDMIQVGPRIPQQQKPVANCATNAYQYTLISMLPIPFNIRHFPWLQCQHVHQNHGGSQPVGVDMSVGAIRGQRVVILILRGEEVAGAATAAKSVAGIGKAQCLVLLF